MLKQTTYAPLAFLEKLGETAVFVAIVVLKTILEYLFLILKFVWDKTIMFREKLVYIGQYIFVFVASPFVKMSINLHNMRRDMSEARYKKGGLRASLVCIPYIGKFMFGRRGLFVTSFNYAAPILSIIFLLNVISYATATNFSLRLTINGEFFGYIESEQVFLDAEASVLQRVNYFGSGQTIELNPEFAIANAGSNDTLTRDQVANLILRRSDFNLTYAHGFFIDGNLHGAILDEDLPLIRETINSLLSAYAGNNIGGEYSENDDDSDDLGETDDTNEVNETEEPTIQANILEEEVSFMNHVVWEGYDLFLEESVVSPEEIIAIITATRANGDPYLPVMVTRVEEYNAEVAFESIERPDDTLFSGSTSVVQQGILGINRVTARVSYVNGVEIRRNVMQTAVVSEPTTQIVNRGTRQHTTGVTATEQRHYGMFIWPVVDTAGNRAGTITRGIGGGHNGLDIAVAMGTPIVAGAGGVVELSQYNNGSFGHTVVIRHEDGKRTLYAHASALHVREGEIVTQGQQIASIGSTGRSTGPHLHFEVIEAGGNRRLNPRHFLPNS
ncbi:MAG: peptidoglycan DD-metalloendopeptidase family protein [Oscillospiraceae bacterium]|nr:peptidoglycan DD-metalloendopeptidase family protein [Oscillospiraceae bacterium]